jgi:malonate-semialdehyde dehydrogenase (acetylating)/methylmalonate-semialdehyde dehydrogenase
MGDKIEGIFHASLSIDLIATIFLSIVSKDMDTEVRRVPLGVCASIAPFNFPA